MDKAKRKYQLFLFLIIAVTWLVLDYYCAFVYLLEKNMTGPNN